MKNVLKSVVVVTTLHPQTGQMHFAGILDASLRRGHWQITVVSQEDFTASRLKQLIKAGTDGFIIHVPGTPEAMKRLLASDVPTVLVNVGGYHIPDGRKRISFVWTDNQAIGDAGAEHFLSKGHYRSFAFVHSASLEQGTGIFWSQERMRGFLGRLRKSGISGQVFSADGHISRFLQDIDKPAAIMASCDIVAERLVAECKRLSLAIPDEISVLGADNSASCDKGISSVCIDFRHAGEMEAIELDALMRKPLRRGAAELMIPANGVLVRKSTALSARSDIPLRALRFISQNACRGISVGDVVAHLGCSRRLAELRFRQFTHRTIRTEIERVRIDYATGLLKKRTLTLKAIANQCGYTSADILMRALSRTQRHPKSRQQSDLSDGQGFTRYP